MAKSSEIAVVRRIYHWVNLISIITLALTGWYIHSPYMTDTFSMGFMRTVHFTAMWVFTTNFMLRVWWAFFGKGGDWKKYLVLRLWDPDVLKATTDHYLLYKHWPEGMTDRIVQNSTYLMLAVLYLLQIGTGFALYYNGGGYTTFILNLVGGLQAVRQIHLFLMWFFIMFTVIHFYMVVAEEWDKLKLMFFGIADER